MSENAEPSFVERNGINPVLFSLTCLGVIFVLYFMGSVGTMYLAGSSVTRENVVLHRILTLGGHAVFFFLPVLFCARLVTVRLSELFPWRLPSFRETFFGLIGLFWLQQISQVYLFFQDRIPLPAEIRQVLEPIKRAIEATLKEMVRAESLPELLFVVVVVAVVPAIVEEMLFRGFVQGSFQRRLSPMRAAFFAGIIFGMFHLNPFAIVPLVALGWYFGFLRLRSNSIIIAMTAHFLNNTLAVLAVYFGMDEEAILGSATGIEPTTGAVLAQFILYALLFGVSVSAYIRATESRVPG
jgi:membrane protease YdiL (CAAX protease family)